VFGLIPCSATIAWHTTRRSAGWRKASDDMYAKNIERILGLLCQRSDVAHATAEELQQRFDSLRRYDRLPRGRERRGEDLSNAHIAAAVFGLIPTHPAWAGHAAIILQSLCPVGGAAASFMAGTLGDVVGVLLSNDEARKCFTRMTLTMAETGMNSYGGAEVVYQQNGEKKRVFCAKGSSVAALTGARDRLRS
jgi:hypothetical protein